MHITRNTTDTFPGPENWFTGNVYVDPIAAPVPSSGTIAGLPHFTPGARTAWHRHPVGQTIYVLEGVALCQAEGQPIQQLNPGDKAFFEPGENHWHGAAPNRLMTHLALTYVDETGTDTTWGEHVTDAQYNGPRATA